MATATSRGPNLVIQTFGSNQGEDFATWLNNEFLRKFRANNWPENSKAQVLPGFLSGHALFVYQSLPAATQNDYDTLIPELEARLLTQERRRRIGQSYETRMQGENETLYEYVTDLSNLARSALGYMTIATERQVNLRDRFISGLKPDMRRQVLLMSPETFYEALEAAERVESTQGVASNAKPTDVARSLELIQRRLGTIEKPSHREVSAISRAAPVVSEEPPPQWAAQMMTRMQHWENQAARPRSNQSTYLGTPNTGTMYGRQHFTPAGTVVCQVCNKAGHSAIACQAARRFCEFHQTFGHNTSECRAQRAQTGWQNSSQRGRGQYSGNGPRNLSQRLGNPNGSRMAGTHCIQQHGYGYDDAGYLGGVHQATHGEPNQSAFNIPTVGSPQQAPEFVPISVAGGSEPHFTSFLGTLVTQGEPLDLSFKRVGIAGSSNFAPPVTLATQVQSRGFDCTSTTALPAFMAEQGNSWPPESLLSIQTGPTAGCGDAMVMARTDSRSAHKEEHTEMLCTFDVPALQDLCSDLDLLEMAWTESFGNADPGSRLSTPDIVVDAKATERDEIISDNDIMTEAMHPLDARTTEGSPHLQPISPPESPLSIVWPTRAMELAGTIQPDELPAITQIEPEHSGEPIDDALPPVVMQQSGEKDEGQPSSTNSQDSTLVDEYVMDDICEATSGGKDETIDKELVSREHAAPEAVTLGTEDEVPVTVAEEKMDQLGLASKLIEMDTGLAHLCKQLLDKQSKIPPLAATAVHQEVAENVDQVVAASKDEVGPINGKEQPLTCGVVPTLHEDADVQGVLTMCQSMLEKHAQRQEEELVNKVNHWLDRIDMDDMSIVSRGKEAKEDQRRRKEKQWIEKSKVLRPPQKDAGIKTELVERQALMEACDPFESARFRAIHDKIKYDEGVQDSATAVTPANVGSSRACSSGTTSRIAEADATREKAQRRGRRSGKQVKQRTCGGSLFKANMFFFTLCCFVGFTPSQEAQLPNPLICQTEQHRQLWRLPSRFNCSVSLLHDNTDPAQATIRLYKRNLVQYSTEAWLCHKLTTKVKVFSYFFNDERMKEEETTEEIVDAAECNRMKTFKTCSSGKLSSAGGLWATSNKLNWEYPGGGIYCCRWKLYTATNCFLYKVKVYKRHGSKEMESTAGDVSHCGYEKGHCSLQSGKYLLWTPDLREKCAILPWKQVNGQLQSTQWVADDGNLALTFHKRGGTSTVTSCEGQSVRLSDHGIPFVIVNVTSPAKQYEALKVIQAQQALRNTNRPTRLKRSGKVRDTGVVSSELLAASLQALEIHMKQALKFSFKHTMTTTCNNMRHVVDVLQASIIDSPTLTMRKILGHDNLIAQCAGSIIEVWPCVALEDQEFQFRPMNQTCTYEIPMRITKNNRTYNAYLDPKTNIVSRYFSQEVDCAFNSERPVLSGGKPLLYNKDGTLRPLGPIDTIKPFEISTDFEALNDVIFEPVVMYHVDEFRSHISLNDMFQTYHQQQKVLTLLGMSASQRDPDEAASRAASQIVSMGFLGFLRGLYSDPLQIWIFCCCVYVTFSLVRRLLRKKHKYWGKLKKGMESMAKVPAYAIRKYRWLNGNAGNGSILVTTLDARSKLNVPGDVLQSTQNDMIRLPALPTRPFKPYRLSTLVGINRISGTIPVAVQGRTCQALFDTGAETSLIEATLASGLPNGHVLKRESIRSDYWQVTSATGHLLQLEGTIRPTIQVGRVLFEGPLIVAQRLPHEVILGRNFIKHLGDVTVNYDKNTISFEDTRLNIVPDSSEKDENFVILNKSVVLPPRSESIVLATLKQEGGQKGGDYFIEATPKAWRTSAIVASAIVKATEREQIPVRILNPGTAPIQLYKGARIATAQSLTKEQVTDIDVQIHERNTVLNYVAVQDQKKNNDSQPNKFKDLDLELCSLDLTSREKFRSLLLEYEDIFSGGDHDLEGTNLVHHRIHTDDAAPIRQKPYRTAFALRDVIRDKIKEMLRNNIIEYSTSEWASPIVMVKKKDGSWRFCVDYRKLNAVTRKDSYPLKRIDDVLGSLAKPNYFCTLDLQSGYHQIPMDDESCAKTAFVTYEGLFQYKRMPFGLCNAPATFQRLMECVLAGLDWRICLVYLDDILIMGSTGDELLDRLRQVFQRLRTAGLKLKLKKCAFGRNTVPFLGHILSKDGFFPECNKVNQVRNWPVPTCSKDVASFLGLASYYRQFIWCFAKTASPLHNLVKKQTKFEWTEKCQEAFDTLKKKLTEAPVLAFPDFNQPFNVQTDASNEAIGAVLSQIGSDGKEHPTSYASRALNKAERRYPVAEKETLAVVWAIRHFRAFIYGRSFTVTTDHQPLRWLLSVKDPNGRLCQWSLLLQAYDMTIVHRPGKENRNADALSRRPESAEEPTMNQPGAPCAICNDLHRSMRLNSDIETKTCPMVATVNIQEDKQQDWRRLQLDDDIASSLIRFLEENGKIEQVPSRLRNKCHQFVMKEGVLWRIPEEDHARDQLFVPQSQQLQILTACHDHFFGGHLGVKKAFGKLSARYYWPTSYKDVKRWCRSCEACATRKPPKDRNIPPLHSIQTVAPWHQVACDIVGNLPLTKQGNKYIVVFADYFTKWVECFAVPDTKTERIAKIFVNELVCRYGVPYSILTDQGPNLVSEIIQETCRLLGIWKLRTTAYHPACDGMVERFNRTMETMISLYVSKNQDDWDQILPMICFAYRTSVHNSTNASPFYLNFGREPALPLDIAVPRPSSGFTDVDDYRAQLVERMTTAWTLAEESTVKAQRRQKEYHDRKCKGLPLMEGDKVYMCVPQVGRGKTMKFARTWRGPFIIIEVADDGTGAVIKPCIGGPRGQTKRVNIRRLKLAPTAFGPVELKPIASAVVQEEEDDGQDNELDRPVTSTDACVSSSQEQGAGREVSTEEEDTRGTATRRYNMRSRKKKLGCLKRHRYQVNMLRNTASSEWTGPCSARPQFRQLSETEDIIAAAASDTLEQARQSCDHRARQRADGYGPPPMGLGTRPCQATSEDQRLTSASVAALQPKRDADISQTGVGNDRDNSSGDLRRMLWGTSDVELLALYQDGLLGSYWLTTEDQFAISQRIRKIQQYQTAAIHQYRVLEGNSCLTSIRRQKARDCDEPLTHNQPADACRVRRPVHSKQTYKTQRLVVFRANHPFSPTYPCRFQVGHQWFTSADQCQRYYRVVAHGWPADAVKLVGAEGYQVEALSLKSPATHGSQTPNKPILTKEDLVQTARSANWHKFTQNWICARQLIDTGTSVIVFHEADLFWGSGPHLPVREQHDGLLQLRGRNTLGKMLMQIREDLKRNPWNIQRPVNRIPDLVQAAGRHGYPEDLPSPGISKDPFLGYQTMDELEERYVRKRADGAKSDNRDARV